jgi:hypothetical protein
LLEEGHLGRTLQLIRKFDLHARSGCGEPVVLDALFEPYRVASQPLGNGIKAVTFRWSRMRRRFVRITYDAALTELSRSAERRHAIAHELAHEICRHPGDQWIYWSDDAPAWTFYNLFNAAIERECDLVASLLLIPLPDLVALSREGEWYTARALDVPQRLVQLRQALHSRWKV